MANWKNEGDLQKREYGSYEEYTEHQARKLGTINLKHYEPRFYEALTERVDYLVPMVKGRNVLCLGARTGIECKVFAEKGAFSIGIDLNPGEDNKYVLPGDFHSLQFADNTVDAIYCNALDHAFDLPRILAEVKRALKEGGIFIAEIVDPTVRDPGEYEALWWKTTDDVVNIIKGEGMTLWEKFDFKYPWEGTHAVFVNSK